MNLSTIPQAKEKKIIVRDIMIETIENYCIKIIKGINSKNNEGEFDSAEKVIRVMNHLFETYQKID